MAKERARRRAAREHEAALRTAARAASQERRERQAARTRAVRALTTDRLPAPRPRAGRQSGTLAQRRRRQTSVLIALLVCLNIVVWVVRPDWESRLAVLVFAVLAFPVLRLLLFSRR